MADKEIRELCHLYVDGAFSRRELIRRARQYAGGVAAVSATLTAMSVPMVAQQCSDDLRVAADDPAIIGQDVEYPGDGGVKLMSYVVKPKRDTNDPIPGVLVIHENRGLNEHIRDVTRRVAKAGFWACGIDLLARQGGTGQFADATTQQQAYGRTVTAERLADMKSTLAYMRTQPDVRANRLGAVGFCAGGGNVWLLTTSGEELSAGVVYYGAPVPAADTIPNIKAAILCHYAELDRALSNQSAAIVSALIANQKTFGFHYHEGVGHAFNNDTGAAFNATAACSAWALTLDFFTRHLNKPDA